MPKSIALSLERMRDSGDLGEMTQCVALERGVPGLGLSRSGAVLWKSAEPADIELYVDDHERLTLRRRHGSPRVVLDRASRPLTVIVDTPTVVLDQDVIELLDRRLRVHVHGPSPSVVPPTPLEPDPSVTSAEWPPLEPVCRYRLPSPALVVAWNPKRSILAVGCLDGTMQLLDWNDKLHTLALKVSVTLEEVAPPKSLNWCTDGFFLCCRGADGAEQFLSLGDENDELPEQVRWATASDTSHDGQYRAELEGHKLLILDA